MDPGKYEYTPGIRRYNAAHENVVKTRGRAAEYECLHCGGPARDWAYNHSDPNEAEQYREQTKAIVFYSMHAEYYIPLCKTCHLKYDRK